MMKSGFQNPISIYRIRQIRDQNRVCLFCFHGAFYIAERNLHPVQRPYGAAGKKGVITLTAVIENNGNTLVLDFPKSRPILEAELASVEIQELAHEIPCADEESVPIKVKITGNDDFERIIAAAVHPSDTIAAAGSACDLFCGLPPRIGEYLKQDILENGLSSLSDFFSKIFQAEKETVVERFCFPLAVTLYPYNEYGDPDETAAEELDGIYAADYEFTIRTRLEKEQRGFDMAEYFNGSESAVDKLRSVKWDVEEIDGCLYGRITARLSEPFDPEERAEFVDWALGQNSDGLGESFEQRPIRTDDGEMYVSFWNPGPDYFICSEDKLKSAENCPNRMVALLWKAVRRRTVQSICRRSIKYPWRACALRCTDKPAS